MIADGRDRSRKVAFDVFRKDMTSGPDSEIDAIESQLLAKLTDPIVVILLEVFGEHANQGAPIGVSMKE